MGFKQHISRTWQMIEQQVNDVPFRPDYEAESELASSAGAKIVLEREKRHRGAAPRTRRMQRMEHCHDWAEKEQCDRSRESRSQASKLRVKSKKPNRKQKCRPQTFVLRSVFLFAD